MRRTEEYGFPSVPPVKEGKWEKKRCSNPLNRDCIRPSGGVGEGTRMYLKRPFRTWPISSTLGWVWNIVVGINSLLSLQQVATETQLLKEANKKPKHR